MKQNLVFARNCHLPSSDRHGRATNLLVLALLTLGLAAPLWAAESPEPGQSVVVIYNAQMPESKEIADHYAERRLVPASQVIGLPLPKDEVMSRTDYSERLLKPLAKLLEEKKLFTLKPGAGPSDSTTNRWVVTEAKVRYAVLCYGIPLKIAEDPKVVEPGGALLQSGVGRNEAAVDSELALLPVGSCYKLAGPLANPFYCATNSAVLTPVNGLLMVARLDGPTPAIARALVDKAIQAETDGLWGRGYFDARGLTNGPYKVGDSWIVDASGYVRRFGFETFLDTNEGTLPASFPMSQIAFYAGWYDWNASGPFARPDVEFMPGAFAYHLQSFSAHTLRSANANWVGPLLNAGATVTMGSVNEPFLDGTPNIAIFFNRWLAPHYSFGEAAYVCQATLSWQTTVVGDPLYRPFLKRPEALHAELLHRSSKLIEWSHLRVIDLNSVSGTTLPELTSYLEQEPTTRVSAVLTEKLGDIYMQGNKPQQAIKAYQEALKLNPSRQQSIRLTFTLAGALIAAGREAEAFTLLDRFYVENPNYPGALDLCQKQQALAAKLKRASDAKRYAKELKQLTAAKAKAEKK